jgi:exosortase/archaeosortase family protein
MGIGRREALLWIAGALFTNATLQTIDVRSFYAFGASLGTQDYICWLAWYAVIYRIWASGRTCRASQSDCLLALATCLSILLTNFVFVRSGLGLWATTTAAYFLTAHRGNGHLKAAGSVLLGLSVSLVWGPMFYQFMTPELLRGDATIVGGILSFLRPDVIWRDTSFYTPDGNSITLIGACSSFQNVSAALLAVTAIAMLTRTEWLPRDIAAAVLACIAMILMNAARICLFVWNPSSYQYWHDGAGSPLFSIAETLIVLAIAWWAVAPRSRTV